jgi:hypothetical protein
MKESTKISFKSQTKCITTFWTLMQESSSIISWLTKICLGSDSILLLTLTYGQEPDSVKNSKRMFLLRFILARITSGFIHRWEELMSATISEEYLSTQGNSSPNKIRWRCIYISQMSIIWRWVQTMALSSLTSPSPWLTFIWWWVLSTQITSKSVFLSKIRSSLIMCSVTIVNDENLRLTR